MASRLVWMRCPCSRSLCEEAPSATKGLELLDRVAAPRQPHQRDRSHQRGQSRACTHKVQSASSQGRGARRGRAARHIGRGRAACRRHGWPRESICGFVFAPPFLAARTGGLAPCRFSQEVPGLLTRSSCAARARRIHRDAGRTRRARGGGQYGVRSSAASDGRRWRGAWQVFAQGRAHDPEGQTKRTIASDLVLNGRVGYISPIEFEKAPKAQVGVHETGSSPLVRLVHSSVFSRDGAASKKSGANPPSIRSTHHL